MATDDSELGTPLPDDAIVIRGGTMRTLDLIENALDHNSVTVGQEWAISVSVFPKKMGFKTACRKAALWNSQICLSTVAEIQGLGYLVRFDGGPRNHANIMLSAEPKPDEMEILKKVFHGPIRNPGQRVKPNKLKMLTYNLTKRRKTDEDPRS